MKKFHFAPVQGHTDAPYRHFHNELYKGNNTYYTPFIRLEHGDLRARDYKDYISPLNDGTTLVPQIIFKDEPELTTLISKIKETGAKRIDLNMGCPFPLQTGHKRGAATISDPIVASAVAKAVNDNKDISFSLKIRLGLTDPNEWKKLIPILNDVDLTHITVHPRIAKQQYSGEIIKDSFLEILSESRNPVVYNGDIKTPDEIRRIMAEFPSISGIMVGRGILGRPSLIEEAESDNEWSREERLEKMLTFHRRLMTHYESLLCGECQLLAKIKPFWEFAEEEIGRKSWKAIKKACNIAKYNSAVASIS